MAKKKNVAAVPKATGAPDDHSPQRFEKELQNLAAKAKDDSWSKSTLGQASLYLKTALVLALLGAASNASQLALSPVFGSIPASIPHGPVIMAGCFVGWAGNLFLNRILPFPTELLLPVVALHFPVVQFLLGPFSDQLGSWWGPLAIEGLTLFPLSIITAACVADYLERADLSALPQFVADAAPGIGSWGLFRLAERVASEQIQAFVGKTFVLTRVGLQLLLAALYAVLAPSKYLVLAIPALLHTAVLNTHVMTPMATSSLNSTLIAQNWTLLDRQESLTGYISVLEDTQKGVRVLRCDHSLLGGEWVRYKGPIISEPIYGVFVMLEAVRLVKREVPVVDSEASALVVGLGIGTTPSAFVTHGINTTVVEIDPVVHEFAAKHFDLRENNPPVIADAVSYTAKLANESTTKFDYIVHDVFTGGAEPADLFTLEFFEGLDALLKDGGSIAINYAGDFGAPTPKMIIRTITKVFPSCRVFREAPRVEATVEAWGSDFINMVIFCQKTPGDLTFRQPVRGDLMESRSRHVFLEPRHEINPTEWLEGDDKSLLTKNNTAKVTKMHQKSATGHWSIMRTVIPPHIWEMW
ncbi:S-adenosyl-L-methionine-dependent methyltransferase [Dactylonectria macrodidyma]|uniref:S-adenosyl-L-methionine-dependent methyltransferase n=1 Tax=Dactylonectria macrodidyma TaxID=307937 RepID=A0A9P9FFN6_9HYPO|nr:S-adenosyl-L-methionine-dependent methyltransferase [Dactylonectria macrodidyma]